MISLLTTGNPLLMDGRPGCPSQNSRDTTQVHPCSPKVTFWDDPGAPIFHCPSRRRYRRQWIRREWTWGSRSGATVMVQERNCSAWKEEEAVRIEGCSESGMYRTIQLSHYGVQEKILE